MRESDAQQAVAALERLLALIDSGDVAATAGLRGYLQGVRDTLAKVHVIDPPDQS
jgi:hypothetical protein